MSKLFRKRLKKAGQSPGTLTVPEREWGEKIAVSLIEYDKTHITENPRATIKDCLVSLDKPSITWINIHGIYDTQAIETLGRHFGLHPLMLEDIVTSGQRSKLDDYKKSIFIVLRLLKYNQDRQDIEDEQVSIILGSNYVITFEEAPEDVFDPVRDRIRKKNSIITQRGADYLCYALMDCIVDHAFLILEKLDERIEKLELQLLNKEPKTLVTDIQRVKHDIVLLRKSVWPMREVIGQFRRLDTPLIKDTTKLYMQDVYDHTIQVIDTIESFRDVSGGLLDIHLSNLNMRMNEIMKVLTIVATIFVPLTFIASIFGMNFEHMPELHSKWGYPISLGVMAAVALSMLFFFRRNKWI
ncbi:MAG: magnesium/cobalt transporter CorA [Parachlamydia sp.]|nr:magnesium/cobalt transporter CorA [Parachlamydia sp.]